MAASPKEIPGNSSSTLTIGLTEPDASTAVWVIKVFVFVETTDTDDENPVFLGQFLTEAPNGGEGNRIVGFAQCPGTTKWRVEAEPDDPAAEAVIRMMIGEGGPEFEGPVSPVSPVTPANDNQPKNWVYVSETGVDADGLVGKIQHPFGTVQAAFDAAIAAGWDTATIKIASGTYDGPVIVPNLGTAFVMEGDSADNTVLRNPDGVCVQWNPTTGAALTVRNLQVVSTSGSHSAFRAFQVDVPNSAQLYLENVRASAVGEPGFLLNRIALLSAINCVDVTSVGMQISDIDRANVIDLQGHILASVSSPMPPTVNHDRYYFDGCNRLWLNTGIPVLEQIGLAVVECSETCEFDDYVGADINGGGVIFHGGAVAMEVDSPIPLSIFNLEQARIPALEVFHHDAGEQRIFADGAVLGGVVLDSDGGGALILRNSGGSIDLASSVFGADCYLDDDGGSENEVGIIAGGDSLAFGVQLQHPPYPPGVSVTPVASLTAQPTALDQYPSTSNASNAGFDVGNDNAADTEVNLVWKRVNNLGA